MYSVFLNKAKFYLKKWADTKGTLLLKIILYTVEGDQDTVRASGADDAHQEHCCVLPPHGAHRSGVRQVQHGDHRGRVHQVGIGVELLAGHSDYDAAGDNSPGEGGDM